MTAADEQEMRGRLANLETCLPVLAEILQRVATTGTCEVERNELPRLPLPQWVGLLEYIGLHVGLVDPSVEPALLEGMTGPATSPSFRIVVSRSPRPGTRLPSRGWPLRIRVGPGTRAADPAPVTAT